MQVFLFVMILPLVFFGFGMIITSVISKCFKNREKKQVKNIDKTRYYRDIPCYGNINIAYWLLYNFSDLKKEELNNGLIGAYLLKWYKNDYINITQLEHSNNNYKIDLKDGNWEKNPIEESIYNFLKRAAGKNNILEKNEIRRFCSINRNRKDLRWLFKNILTDVQKDLENKKLINIITQKKYISLTTETETKVILSDEIIEEYEKLNGLKNFLSDYSNMEDKKYIEIHLWEEYIIFANLFGIADKIEKQFKKLYPNLSMLKNIESIAFENTISGTFDAIYESTKQEFISALMSILVFILYCIFKKITGGKFYF